MKLKGWEREVVREIIVRAIKNGKVKGNIIVFRMRDIGKDDIRKMRGIRFCMKSSKQVFRSVRDKKGLKLYIVDEQTVKCYGDEELIRMFRERIEKEG